MNSMFLPGVRMEANTRGLLHVTQTFLKNFWIHIRAAQNGLTCNSGNSPTLAIGINSGHAELIEVKHNFGRWVLVSGYAGGITKHSHTFLAIGLVTIGISWRSAANKTIARYGDMDTVSRNAALAI